MVSSQSFHFLVFIQFLTIYSTLAQETLSSYSLGRSTPPAQKDILRSKFSRGRLRSEPSNLDLSPSTNPSPARSPLNGRFPSSPRDNDPPVLSVQAPMPTATSHTAKGNLLNVQDNVHPYANPDLAVVDLPPPPFRATSSCQQHIDDEANIALSESCSTDLISRTSARDITVNSALPKRRMSSIQAKNISSPVSVIGASYHIETPLAENRQEQNSISPGIIPGWTDPNPVPAFSLISLEEARAQRMRSATANPTSGISGAGMSDPSAIFPLMEVEAIPGADSSHVGGSITRARTRSISAGANKARSALHVIVGQPKPERRDSEPNINTPQPSGTGHPGKTLKHKKSGFMRLFNVGKMPEKDEEKMPPPVPSLSDSHSISHVQRIPKSSIHRIPVPSLSPSLFESSSTTQSSDAFTGDTWKQNAKCTPPSLTINTQPPVVDIASVPVTDNRQNETQASPSFSLSVPRKNDQPLHSAPATVSEFPALKLRPVSTLFSAHFGDHIVATESPEIGSVTPRSSSPRAVTLTPASAIGASHEQSFDDQASVVRSLQEQLVTEKKAWQMYIWELEEQVRDLKATVEELKGSDNKDYCKSCGRGKEVAVAAPHLGSVVHRPRARTGTSSRFTNALP